MDHDEARELTPVLQLAFGRASEDRGEGHHRRFFSERAELHDPAHRFHEALSEEIVNRGHVRLGDAVLGGQAAYSETGAFPELLGIYHKGCSAIRP